VVKELHETQQLFLASKALSDQLLISLCTILGITKAMLEVEAEELRRKA